MAEFPALPLWTDAYLADCGHLTTIEHGAYLLLLMTMWRAGGKLPNDDKKLARFARLNSQQWQRIKPSLWDFFEVSDGFISQGRLTDELAFVKQNSTKQSNKARARWLKNKDSSNAAAMPNACRNDAPTPTPTPTPTPIKKESPKGDSKKSKRFESNCPDFEEFWEAYPKGRTGKRETVFRAWQKAVEVASAADIIMGARAYRRSEPGEFVKGAAAWLNDERWRINYDRLRKPTAEEQLQDWINGDERDDSGSRTINGECVEVSGDGFEGDGWGLPHGATGLERRASGGSRDGPVVELGQGDAAAAGGNPETGRRVQDLIAKAATAAKAGTKP